MQASRTFTVRAGDLAARSGVPMAGIVRWQASPTRRSGLNLPQMAGHLPS
jgi:hypothetical protein